MRKKKLLPAKQSGAKLVSWKRIIDTEELVDRLSSKDYHSKDANPAGWLIDEIEEKLPLKKEYVSSLKKAIKEAKEKGWIPFEKIEQDVLH